MTPIILGNLSQGLYFADPQIFNQDKSSVAHSLSTKVHLHVAHSGMSNRLDEGKLLHLRMGHIPFSQLQFVDNNVDVASITAECICSIYHAARQHRLSFSTSEINSQSIFEMIHVDVWGPYKSVTHDGCSMFFIIVDDFSRATWIHLMKYKTVSVDILDRFIIFFKNRFQFKS